MAGVKKEASKLSNMIQLKDIKEKPQRCFLTATTIMIFKIRVNTRKAVKSVQLFIFYTILKLFRRLPQLELFICVKVFPDRPTSIFWSLWVVSVFVISVACC